MLAFAMDRSAPIVVDVVLVGGGHSHIEVLRRFGMNPIPGVRLTVVSRDARSPYSGMLPGLVAGRYDDDDAHIDLRPLARFAGARMFCDEVVGLDLPGRRVLCRARPPVRYDLLSINVGSAPSTAGVPGAAEHAIPVKPIDGFRARWRDLAERVIGGDGPIQVAVVGGGAGGVELALAADRRLRDLAGRRGDRARLSIHIVEAGGDLLPGINARARRMLRRTLRDRGVAIHLDHRVTRVSAGGLCFDDGSELAADEILWTTSAAPAPWLAESGLATDATGFVAVDDALRSTSHPEVFAAGDAATMVRHPRPKSGVFAVRQGPVLADNLARALRGRRLRRFTPQRQVLGLIGTGDGRAVGARGPLAFEGAWVWAWKDWIDRRFMARYRDLPEMEPEAPDVPDGVGAAEAREVIARAPMRCGGCGSKVGATVLERALSRLEPVDRDDVVAGLRAPDDAAVVDVGAEHLEVHSADGFRAMIDDPYVFGQIAAHHGLADVYAMGAEPRTALAIASVPYGVEDKMEDDLAAMLLGADEVLRAAGCALVGGHTAESPELSLSLALTGRAARGELWHKRGAAAGDLLVITKPLGTGALFAADMRHRARGAWIEDAIASMLLPAAPAVAALRRHGARACTDVSGFGLLGHLVEMARASAVDAEIDVAAVPVLAGALEVVGAGFASSLAPANLRLRRALRDDPGDHPRAALLFDPQTAGGLLASVPAERAPACVEELRAAGFAHAAAIGRVVAADGGGGEVALEVSPAAD